VKPVIKQLEFLVIYVMASMALAGLVRFALMNVLEFLQDLPVTNNLPDSI
jgi:hypothetical protein